MMSEECQMIDFTFDDLGLGEFIDTNTLFHDPMSNLKKSPGHESVTSEMYSVDGESLQSATEDLQLADVDFSALMDDEANNALLPLLPVPEESIAGAENQMINVCSPGASDTTQAVSETVSSAQVLLEQMSEGRITPQPPSPPVSVKVVHHMTDNKRASSSRSKGKKQIEMPDSEVQDRNRKNAIQAKINREKKKQQMKSLEDDVKNLTKDNEELKSRNQQLDEEKKSLEEEVAYLKSVLANQSTLSSLLQNIDNVQGVSLTTSFTASRKRSMDHDHDYHERPAKRGRTSGRSQMKSDPKTSGGVCLHVAKDKVSMEFCSSCAKMATGGKRPRPSP